MEEPTSKQNEPDTYDLAEPDDAPVTKPAAPPAKAKAGEPAKGRTYDLEAEPQAPAKPSADAAAKLATDPRFAAEPKAPPPPRGDSVAADTGRVKTGVYTPEADEPAYVSPEVAASRREEARIRAAQLAAEADARKRKRVGIIVAVVVLAALLGVAVWQAM